MNPYESGQQRAIPATLVYGFYPADQHTPEHVLMIKKAKKDGSIHSGKYNGLGGKANPNESPSECALREFNEESGLSIQKDHIYPLGVLTFPNFKNDEDWIVHVFWADLSPFKQQAVSNQTSVFNPENLLTNNDEGSLHFIPTNEILNLNLWEGDKEFIPFVLRRQPFIGTFWYKNSMLDRFELFPLS